VTSVAVVIPAYNEGEAFASTLSMVAEYFALHRGSVYAFEYVVVDDGSTDATSEAADEFARCRPNVRVLRHAENRGLGAALRTAFAHVSTDLAVVLDADLSYSPATCMELIEALEQEGADVALASPYARGGAVVNVPPLRRILSRNANRLLSLAVRGRVATLTCMVRAYRGAALRRLTFASDRMEAIAEQALCAMRLQLRVVEIPATLRWSEERRRAGGRLRVARLAAQIWATLAMAFRHRPALWLAVPGLFPGLLPIVIAILLALHVRPGVLAAGTALTAVVQYTSLGIFAGQLGTYVHTTQRRRRRRAKEVAAHDYDLPARTT
jgi:dolichol-phosphate mannosyltransferase